MIKVTDIKDIIMDNEKCYFSFYLKGNFYYSFYFKTTECIFPIPLEGLCSTRMDLTEKTIRHMGYIKRAIEKELIIYKEID